jgi:hypothetical protein
LHPCGSLECVKFCHERIMLHGYETFINSDKNIKNILFAISLAVNLICIAC